MIGPISIGTSIINNTIGGFSGPLDGVSATINALYSPSRRMLASYKTNALIRVRRDIDNNESNFGWDVNGDLDTAAISDWNRSIAVFDDSSTDYLTGGDQAEFELAQATTWGAYFRTDSLAVNQSIFSKDGESANREWDLFIRASDDALVLNIYGSGLTRAQCVWGTPLTANTLYFVEVQWDPATGANGTASLDVNRSGTPVTSAATASIAQTGPRQMHVGARDSQIGKDSYMSGNIVNVFFGHSLFSSTILDDLYNGGVIPTASDLDAATIAACKADGGSDGDLLFFMDEASGDRISYSGNFTLTDGSSVGSVALATVVTIYDQSGNGYDISAPADANEPVYSATAIGSKPGATYDGSNYLRRTTGVLTTWPVSVYTTIRLTDKSGTITYWSSNDNLGSVDYRHMATVASTGVHRVLERRSSNQSTSGTVDLLNTTVVAEARMLATNDRNQTTNGTDATQNTSTQTHPNGLDDVAIGALNDGGTPIQFWIGQIGEIVELSTAPSVADRNLIGNALADHVGATWSDVS